MDCKKGSFTKFPDLPPELRFQIWGEVMGEYGLYLVECNSVLVDRTDEQDGRRILRLALRLAHHDYQVYELRQRAHIQKVLLATCVESRDEFCKRFPDTLSGVRQRFSFRHDVIHIRSAFLPHAFASLGPPPGLHLEFEGGWNRLVHRLALDSDFCQICSVLMCGPGAGLPMDWHSTRLDRSMTFLTTCTSLRQVVLAESGGITFDGRAELSIADRATLSERMTYCYGGLTCQASERFDAEAVNFDETALFLRRIILGDLQSAIHPDWEGKVKAGYPVLRNLEIWKMVHVRCKRWYLYRRVFERLM